jgi:hypothetical protein
MHRNADRWLELYNEGLTHEEIALDHGDGCSTTTVGMALRAHPDYVPRTSSSQRKSKGNRSNKVFSPPSPITSAGRPGARAAHRRRGRGW